MIKNKTNKENKMADENTNAHLENINKNLSNISKCMEAVLILVVNDSNYTAKNKKDINLNVSKVSEVVKQIKDKL